MRMIPRSQIPTRGYLKCIRPEKCLSRHHRDVNLPIGPPAEYAADDQICPEVGGIPWGGEPARMYLNIEITPA